MNQGRQSSYRRIIKLHLVFAFVVLCVITTCTHSSAQDPPRDGRYYEGVAVRAYRNKDYESFLKNMMLAAQLRPGHPRLMYNLAAAYSLTGHHLRR